MHTIAVLAPKFRHMENLMTESVPLAYGDLANASNIRRPPRVWVGIVIVVLQWLAIVIPAMVVRMTMTHFMTMMWRRSSAPWRH